MTVEATLRTALADVGVLLKVYTAAAALSLPVAVYWREYYALPALVATGATIAALGEAFDRAFGSDHEAGLASGVVGICLAWLVVGLLNGLPFALVAWTVSSDPPLLMTPAVTGALATFLSPLDALFEGMSGATGTGLTMVDRPDHLPRTLQWWRSLTQWIGGIGVIVLAAAVVSGQGGRGFVEFHERTAPTGPIASSTAEVASAIFWLVTLLTASAALLFWLVGMPPWHALNHAMTGLTTGGFTVTPDSIAAYDDPALELAALPVMIVGATPFTALYFAFNGHLRVLVADVQTRWLLGGLAALLVVVVGFLAAAGRYRSGADVVRFAAFQVVSGLTCTGFRTASDLGRTWPAAAKAVVAGAMTVGGAAGSTAGGLKLIRVRTLFVQAPIRAVGAYELREAESFEFGDVFGADRGEREDGDDDRGGSGGDGSEDDSEGASAGPFTAGGASTEFDVAAGIGFLWFLLLGFGILASYLWLPTGVGGYGAMDVVFEVASAQSNVGLSTGIIGEDMPAPVKVAFVLCMWIGRIEIVPVLVTVETLLGVIAR